MYQTLAPNMGWDKKELGRVKPLSIFNLTYPEQLKDPAYLRMVGTLVKGLSFQSTFFLIKKVLLCSKTEFSNTELLNYLLQKWSFKSMNSCTLATEENNHDFFFALCMNALILHDIFKYQQ